MRISLKSLTSSMAYARTHEWACSFGENTLNLWKSGGAVGQVFPAQSIDEPIFRMDPDVVQLPDGFPIEFPRAAFFGGNIAVEFYDNEKVTIHTLLYEWARDVYSHDLGVETIERKAKQFNIAKYTPEGDAPIYENAYMVLPPANLKSAGDSDPALLMNRIELPIIKVLKKMGRT